MLLVHLRINAFNGEPILTRREIEGTFILHIFKYIRIYIYPKVNPRTNPSNYPSNNKGLVERFWRELTFAKRLYKHFMQDEAGGHRLPRRDPRRRGGGWLSRPQSTVAAT